MVYSNVVAAESYWCDKPRDQVPVLQLSNEVSETSRAPARHYEQCANMGGEELAILWMEWCGATGDSIPDMGSPATLPWALAQPLLQYHAARYVVSKNQGHVILAGFDDVNTGLLSAWRIREVLPRVGIRVRVGMHWGYTVVHMHALTSCISMIGASV